MRRLLILLSIPLILAGCTGDDAGEVVPVDPVKPLLEQEQLRFPHAASEKVITLGYTPGSTPQIDVWDEGMEWCDARYSDGTIVVRVTDNAQGDVRNTGMTVIAGDERKTVNIIQDCHRHTPFHSCLKITAGQATSEDAGAAFTASFDGNPTTSWRSDPDRAGEYPVTMTYDLEDAELLNYIVFYPDSDSATGMPGVLDIEVMTAGGGSFTKVLADYDLGRRRTASLIEFSQPQKNVRSVRLTVKSSEGGVVGAAEVEFYTSRRMDPAFTALFQDENCTTPKVGLSQADVDKIGDIFYRALGEQLLAGEYREEFRSRSYEPYPYPNTELKTNPLNLLDNPTGIAVRAGDKLTVFVGPMHGREISLRLMNDWRNSVFTSNQNFWIYEGFNTIDIKQDGLLYVMYHSPEGDQPVHIHFLTGTVNGYFDLSRHTDSDWKELLSLASAENFDAIGPNVHLCFPLEDFRSVCPDKGSSLVGTWNDIVLLEMQFIGLEKYGKMPRNRIGCFIDLTPSTYMYASSYRTGYSKGVMGVLLDPDKLRTTNIWGPAHEIGHMLQTRPGMLWAGTTEVTNNIKSLYVQTSLVNQSNLTNTYRPAFNNRIVGQLAHGENGDHFERLVPFWQLYLYASVAEPDKKDFYKDLYERVRTENNPSTHGAAQLNYVKMCCEILKTDLRDFFRAWGFLTPCDLALNDYGVKQLTCTEAMIDELSDHIVTLGYPAAPGGLAYIRDANATMFRDKKNVVAGTARRSFNSITLTGWQNVVAWEVYDNDTLIQVEHASTFTLGKAYGPSTEIKAVSWDGTRVTLPRL